MKMSGKVDIKEKRIIELKSFFSESNPDTIKSVEKYNNVLAIVITAKFSDADMIDAKDDIMKCFIFNHRTKLIINMHYSSQKFTEVFNQTTTL